VHLLCARNRNGETLLHAAARAANLELCQLLMKIAAAQQNTDFVDTRSSQSETALHIAISTCCTPIAQLLVLAGANPFVPNIYAETALFLACLAGSLDLARLILRSKHATVAAVQMVNADRLSAAAISIIKGHREFADEITAFIRSRASTS